MGDHIGFFSIIGNSFLGFKNAPRGCAARGDEVYVEHTARARKCAVSAHFILCGLNDRFDV